MERRITAEERVWEMEIPYSPEEVKRRLEKYGKPQPIGNTAFLVFGAICGCLKMADFIREHKISEIEIAIYSSEEGLRASTLSDLWTFCKTWDEIIDECRFLIWIFEPAPSFRKLYLKLMETPEFKKILDAYMTLWKIEIAKREGKELEVMCALAREGILDLEKRVIKVKFREPSKDEMARDKA